MQRTIRTVNFGELSRTILKKENTIIQSVEDDFDPSSIEILDEYKEILELVNEGSNIIFVTGKAGTGKSTLIKYVKYMIEKSVAIAPTTIAAENVKGSTIHSFFGLPPHLFNPEEMVSNSKVKMPLLRDLDLLIVDEVSMVSASMIDAIDLIMKKANATDKAFGGISVMFVGDLFQLPPIITDAEQRKYFSGDSGRYDSAFFISADIFKTGIDIHPIELTKVRRQNEVSENKFVEALNTIRIKGGDLKNSLEELNDKCYTAKLTDESNGAITLAPSRSKVAGINKFNLDNIKAESRMYSCELDGLSLEDVKSFQAPDKLELKVGAQVVFVNNEKPNWINGDLGIVTDMQDDYIEVEVIKTGIKHNVSRVSFKKYRYIYDVAHQKIILNEVGSFIQFPLTLGWAVTIHKSQGMTLEKVIVDIDGSAFADGQTYVALSRVTSIDGLRLASKIDSNDIKVDEGILQFYNALFGGEYS